MWDAAESSAAAHARRRPEEDEKEDEKEVEKEGHEAPNAAEALDGGRSGGFGDLISTEKSTKGSMVRETRAHPRQRSVDTHAPSKTAATVDAAEEGTHGKRTTGARHGTVTGAERSTHRAMPCNIAKCIARGRRENGERARRGPQQKCEDGTRRPRGNKRYFPHDRMARASAAECVYDRAHAPVGAADLLAARAASVVGFALVASRQPLPPSHHRCRCRRCCCCLRGAHGAVAAAAAAAAAHTVQAPEAA